MRADPEGDRAEYEEWMRRRRRAAEIEGNREAQLLAEAEAELQRIRIRRTMQEIELLRIAQETRKNENVQRKLHRVR